MFDPYVTPLGYWSRKAEEWADARNGPRWPQAYALRSAQDKVARLRRELEQERQEVLDLTAELESRPKRKP